MRDRGPISGAEPDLVTVVVVTWERRSLTLRCLSSLTGQTVPYRILVVDNASTDGTAEAIEDAYPEVRVLRLPENRGFAGGVAAALDVVRSRFFALLNNDAVADDHWLETSLAALVDPSVAAVSSRMMFLAPDGSGRSQRVNNAGVVLLRTGYGTDRGWEEAPATVDVPVEVFGFSGGAAVLRTLAVLGVGGVSARSFMYYEDTDLSWRLRLAGWRIVYEPRAIVWHQHAASSDSRSDLFAFYNERNRLTTLIRNAPVPVALGRTARFLLTTASLTAARAVGRSVPPDPVFRPGLRLRALTSALSDVPALVRERRRRPRARPLRSVWDEWAGVSERPQVRARS